MRCRLTGDAAGAIGEVGGACEGGKLANGHLGNALIPATDHLKVTMCDKIM